MRDRLTYIVSSVCVKDLAALQPQPARSAVLYYVSIILIAINGLAGL